jgi:endogenous inhibitor of DNA gyrase (YacG/DUF329 family)
MFNQHISSNGFYYFYDNIRNCYECIKFFDFGIAKKIIYTGKMDDIVDHLFKIENIAYENGFYYYYPTGQLVIQFNTIYGSIMYNCNFFDDKNISFYINYPNGFIQNTTYTLYKINDGENIFNQEEEFICTSCKETIKFKSSDIYNSFACRRCRSVYTYEWIAGKIKVSPLKIITFVPNEIKELLRYFECDTTTINKKEIKSKYRELIKKWHPDRASADNKDMAEKKTTEINLKYETLEKWLKNI